MLTVQSITRNLVEITITGTLKPEDFKEFGKKTQALINEHDSIRVMIDASGFEGWDNFDAAEQHFDFVKRHHKKVERLGIVAGHTWQHWLAALAQVFVHPHVKVFDQNQIEEAKKWLKA
ncbi:SpoIIAA-like [Nitrosomonas sp. Nm51]|uniref:STAS/SEC14 domain-containing protein n=1 Tax=Nitrosomonas sp. Nm51 TaxID=133720 RepID=UPI0008AB3B21|nr:STAS/SEC14 domain-containing protein [Nitrosomonas sp. Nm51]SEQ91093.1 SpoIIAA-like [Nitrosomonas sp. Nm51]